MSSTKILQCPCQWSKLVPNPHSQRLLFEVVQPISKRDDASGMARALWMVVSVPKP
jgi:hypothetical protein